MNTDDHTRLKKLEDTINMLYQVFCMSTKDTRPDVARDLKRTYMFMWEQHRTTNDQDYAHQLYSLWQRTDLEEFCDLHFQHKQATERLDCAELELQEAKREHAEALSTIAKAKFHTQNLMFEKALETLTCA